MEGVVKSGRLNRQGSRLRRQRSQQDWQDYSSSDNEDDSDHQHAPNAYYPDEHEYEDPRNAAIDPRTKHVPDGRVCRGGRGNSSTSSGRSYSHSSMELLTGRNYGALSGSEGDLHHPDPRVQTDPNPRHYVNGLRGGQRTPTAPEGPSNSYPVNYSSLPRQSRSNSLATTGVGTNFRMQVPAGRDANGRSPVANGGPNGKRSGSNGPNREKDAGSDTSPGGGQGGGGQGNGGSSQRTRMGLGLRREQSSTSTSDNNSDATYTDSEPMSRRRDMIHESQNVFCDSPPEPAPPLVPSRNLTAVQHIEAFGLRPRLGYLESECESEPPYLPTMLTSPLPAYSQPDLVNGQSKPLLDNNLESNHTENQRNNSQLNNRIESERIYSQPQIFSKGDTNISMANSTSTTTLGSNSILTTTVTSAGGGPTYSNPLPVFCSTPSSTTGPMVPVTNCVNPQLIQGPTMATAASTASNNRAPFTSAFASSALSTSRFHFRKACNHYCSWKTTCIVLICLVVILTTILTYLAAMSSLNDFPEVNRQCIVMEDQDVPYTATGLPVTAPSNAEHKDGIGGMGGYASGNGGGGGGGSKCNLLPHDMSAYQRVSLGDSLFKSLAPRQGWNVWFSHPNSGFIRFNFTVPHGCRLAVIGRKNDPPTISAHDFTQVIGDDHRKTYKRTLMLREEVSLVQYLVPGDWYLAIVNDDNSPVDVSLQPNTANDVPTSCPSNCHGHGNCQLGKCHCFPGYIGPDCADSVCPVLCSGHGRYVHGSCRCDVGWKGAECSIPVAECEVADCNGNGLCVEGTCLCNSGFKGDHCEEADCIEPECSGHGVCVKGQCWCKIGWRGGNCSQADDRLSRCFPDCAGHGVYDLETEKCVCFRHWTGNDCSKAKCNLDCGLHGQCEEGRCHCDNGWTGTKCDSRTCDPRCLEHGQCNNGTCICIQGWMGRHCTLDGCPNGCSNHGRCQREGEVWACGCDSGWGGQECSVPQETNCRDDMDNDADGLMDCADSECCSDDKCRDSLMCLSSPDPLDILLRKQPPAVTASFYQKMRFLIEEESVQSYAHRDEYTESRVSVIRGQVIGRDGNGLIGIRVSVATDPQFGFTLTRSDGWFDILVNGGSAVTLQFQRNPFHPIKRTVMVPWNDIIVMEPVPMSATASEEPNSLAFGFHEPCVDHDYDVMKPIVYQTWRSGSHGGCTENSAVLTETQVLQESMPILGSDLHLVYHSTHAQGYLSTIHLQLTPSEVPETLRLVHLKIIVEGILFQKTFEADPEIKFTYPWNKRNIYKQKVYGLTVARVFVGFEYSNCPSILWTSQDATIRGYHMDISELGSWNLDIHHRYNFHEGVLQKGDGTTIYFKQQPRVIKVLMGTGLQRPLLCPECNGLARDNKLLAPVALTSGPDGSVYVGDFNLVRRVTPSGQVYTVFRMKTTEVSYQYHVTLSPTDGHLYISDPERHQILRVHSLDKVEDPDSNFDVVVGSGERCLPRDRENCGDGKPALEARLSYPKGMAVAVDNTLYFADGTNIRMVDNRGIIHTLIGDHHHKRQWRPIPCTGTLKLDEVKLRWPTDLAINPLDGLLYFIDDHMVLKVTKDKRVMVMAGQPVYCKNQNQKNQKSRMTEETTLGSLISFAFGPTGLMYIAEVHSNQVHRIRTMSPDRELLHFAGSETACDCAWTNCTCPSNDKVSLAMDTRLYSITSLTVTSDGVVHFADQGSLRVLSAVPFLPQPDEQQVEFRIAYPDNHEIFVFNKYGQHIATRSILTGKTMYTFLYNVNTSFGKLSAVTDASGNKVSFLRDSGNSLHTIETARGQKCRVQVTKQGFLELFVDPTNLETNFYYDGGGLLTSRTDSEGRSFFYLYDDNGRLTEVIKPSGVSTSLTFDLSPSGASVSYTEDGGPKYLVVTVKGTTVISEQGGMFLQTTVHQDGTIEVETPWKVGGVWETAPHSVLREVLPVQAGMFAVPVKQVLYYGMEPTSILEWHYDVKYNRREKGKEEKATSAVERVLSVNGTQFLTVEYDWVAGREILYNSSRRPCLVVQYDSFSRPIQWLPTDTRVPLNVMYDRQGRLSGWQHGTLTETYGYDRLGHLSDLKYTDNHVVKLTYEGRAMPSKVILPSGRAYTFHFDDNGGLKQIATPKGTRHTFLGHISIGFHKFFYTPPGNGAPYVVLFNDMKFPILKIFPGDLGRVLYRYVNQTLLKSVVFGGGKVERNYTTAGFVESELWADDRVEVVSEYGYSNALLTHSRIKYAGKFQLSNLTFVYGYDKGARLRSLATRLEALQLKSIEFGYSPVSGKLTQFGNFRVFERATNDSVISDGTASFARQTDSHHRFRQLSLIISDKEVYRMDLQYDNRNYVTQTKMFVRSLGTSKIRQQNYSYDEDGQLVDTTGKEKWKFNYDQNGNMITMQYQAKRIDILYDAGDRIVSFGETPYLVDGRGYVIQRGEERFFYNVKGQLIRASKNGRFNVEYAYDARGRLAVRKDNFGNLTQFFYANPSKPRLLTHVYNNADGRFLILLYDDSDYPVLVMLNKESFYVACDCIGTPVVVFDKFGEVVKEFHRGPYGHVMFDSNPHFYLPVDFQGGILDPFSGLIHFGERVYDPMVGQWMSPGWDDVLRNLNDPRGLHLYRFNKNDPINKLVTHRNKLEMDGWTKAYGIDVHSLQLSAPDLFHSPYSVDPSPLYLDMPSIPLVSGFACSVRKKIENFAKLSIVEGSKVKKDQLYDTVIPKISTLSVPFGKGIVVSLIEGRAVVRTVGEVDPIRRDAVTSVFNNSYLLDLHLIMHGQDVFYFVKENTWRVGDDLNQLQRLGNMINTTVHESKADEERGSHHVDIRVHAYHAVLNIRYGTTLPRERQRLLRHAKKHAVGLRWALERELVQANHQGSRDWTEKEKEHILSANSVPGYRGDYYHDVKYFPELADDPSNVVFHKTSEKHR